MRLSALATIGTTFIAAAGICYTAAGFVVSGIESASERSVRNALDDATLSWAEVQANGLQVFLSGRAPNEAERFKAVSAAGTVVDTARVIDQMTVKDSGSLTPPRFSIEILRNDSGISLIGLIPAATDREVLVNTLASLTGESQVADLLESADYPAPDAWEVTLSYALDALKSLPRAKLSIQSGWLSINAMSDSAEEKRRLETDLARRTPSGVRLAMQITAPRPVITPFTLRFVLAEQGTRFDACSADTEEARSRIIAAANAAGYSGKANCTIGLGVPSPNWAHAVELAIGAVKELGGGIVTFADADVSLVARLGTEPALFDRVVGELENALPDVFALSTELPRPKEAGAGPVEFTATRSPEGLVQLRGRLTDELARTATESLAKARFGSQSVTMAARVAENLPTGWPLRVLAGIEALALVTHGEVTVTPDTISVTGATGNQDTSAEISRLLVAKLGEGQRFDIAVTHEKKLDPVMSIPKPEECEAEVQAIVASQKINFEPGSATPVADARGVLDDVAEILKKCSDMQMEIGGHTDSQGREEMNKDLSQARANAVLLALRERRVISVDLTAVGYGESQPIADNGTEEGRETNRRIEFKLLNVKPVNSVVDNLLESAEKSDGGEAPMGQTEQEEQQADTPAEGTGQ